MFKEPQGVFKATPKACQMNPGGFRDVSGSFHGVQEGCTGVPNRGFRGITGITGIKRTQGCFEESRGFFRTFLLSSGIFKGCQEASRECQVIRGVSAVLKCLLMGPKRVYRS